MSRGPYLNLGQGAEAQPGQDLVVYAPEHRFARLSSDIEDYLTTIGRWQAKTQMVDALRAEWMDVVRAMPLL